MTVEFAEDGSTVTILNAKALFSTYTEFTLRDGGDTVAKICDYIVKGQPKLEQILNEPYPQTIDDEYFILPSRHEPFGITALAWIHTALPLDSFGFNWVIPTAIAAAIGHFLPGDEIEV